MPQGTKNLAGAMPPEESGTARDDVSTTCIVLPTYNEAENIEKVLGRIFECENAQPDEEREQLSLRVLVVDDNSPDGTALIVNRYMRHDSRVRLLLRMGKGGLGSAYIDGMQHAIETLAPDILIEMDADLSHNPADAFRLVRAIRAGADFAIGSRYVDGGKLPENWGIYRKLVSSASNFATRLILGLGSVRDCTGGFRAIRTRVLRNVDLASLRVKGYAFQAVILEAAVRNGARVREVPISFAERNAGSSKMTVRDLVEGGLVLLRIRLDRLISGRMFALKGFGERSVQVLNGRHAK